MTIDRKRDVRQIFTLAIRYVKPNNSYEINIHTYQPIVDFLQKYENPWS